MPEFVCTVLPTPYVYHNNNSINSNYDNAFTSAVMLWFLEILLCTAPVFMSVDACCSFRITAYALNRSWYYYAASLYYADVACCYSPVAWSVGLSRSWALQNGWTNRDAIWAAVSGGPKEPCIRQGSRSPLRRDSFEGKRSGAFHSIGTTSETSLCDGSVALYQITLTTCYY